MAASEARLSALESCDCQKSCRVNGTTRPDGAGWKMGCEMCQCKVRGGGGGVEDGLRDVPVQGESFFTLNYYFKVT